MQNFTQQLLMQLLHNQIYGRRELNGSDIALVTIYCVIALLSVGGNGFFLFLSFRYRGLRRHISYIMMSLAGSNLLVTCTCLPVSMVKVFYTTWRFGLAGCRLVTFIEGLALSVNSFSLASIAILRARQSALMIPPTQTSNRGLRLLVAGTWLSALLVSLPALFAFTLVKVPVPGPGGNATDQVYVVCSEDRSNSLGQKAYSAYLLVILFLSPCIVLIFSYGFTARFISRQFTRLTKTPHAGHHRNGAVEEQQAEEDVELRQVDLPMTATNQTSVFATARLVVQRPPPRSASRSGGGAGSRQMLHTSLAPSRSPAYQTRKLQKRTVKTVVVLVTLFFFCWFPKDLIILLQDFVLASPSDHSGALLVAYPYTQALIYLHSALCPFLYWSLSRVFQHYVRKAFARQPGAAASPGRGGGGGPRGLARA